MAAAHELDATEPTVRSVYRSELVGIGIDETVEDLLTKLKLRHLNELAVFDAGGNLVGTASLRSAYQQTANTPVRHILDPIVLTVSIDSPIWIVARILVDSRVHRLFVEEDSTVVGVVSQTDITRLVGAMGFHGGARRVGLTELRGVLHVDKPRAIFLASLKRCEASSDFGRRFYENFLGSSPEVAARFANTNMDTQQQKVVEMLRLTADVVIGKQEARARLTDCAVQHNRSHHNVPPKLYDQWLESLVATVRVVDPEFGLAVEYAWRVLVGHVISRMTAHY